MGLAIGAIRTVVREILEGSLGAIHPVTGTFQYGAFDGQPDDAKLARLRQTSTATHWFDVTLGEHENHASCSFSSRIGQRRLLAMPITVDIWSGLGTEAQETDRGALLAQIASDCEDARQSLGYVGSLEETGDELPTGIVSGVMRGPGYAGLPDWERVDEDWGKRWLHSRITGMIVVAEFEDPRSILGSGLHTWLAPDRARDFTLEVNGADTDVTAWRNRTRNGDSLPFANTTSLRAVYRADAINGLPGIDDGGDDTWMMMLAFTNPLLADSRPYVWVVAQLDDVSGVNTQALLGFQGDTLAYSIFQGAGGSTDAFSTSARSSDGLGGIIGPALDGDPHVFEFGWLPISDGRFLVDGVGYDGNKTGGLPEDATLMRLGINSSNAWDGRISEVVICDHIPTPAQLTAMRAYFERKYAIDVSGVDESGSEDGGLLDFSDPNQSGLGNPLGIF